MEYLWNLNKPGIFLDETLSRVAPSWFGLSSAKDQQQAAASEMDVPCHQFYSPICSLISSCPPPSSVLPVHPPPTLSRLVYLGSHETLIACKSKLWRCD